MRYIYRLILESVLDNKKQRLGGETWLEIGSGQGGGFVCFHTISRPLLHESEDNTNG